MLRNLFALLTVILFTVHALNAQKSDLVLSEIMKGEDFIGVLPEEVIWSEDSKKVFFKWKESDLGVKPYYSYDLELNAITEMDAREEFLEIPAEGSFNSDRSLKVYSKSGDIFLYQANSNETKRLTNTLDQESNPKFVLEDKAIVYQNGNNLFLWYLESNAIEQITNFISGKNEEKKASEMDQWLKKDQWEIFDELASEDLKSKNTKKREDSFKKSPAKKIYLNDLQLASLDLSPDGKYVYYQLRKSPKLTFTDNMSFVTESGYTQILKDREKVGSEDYDESLWVYQIEKDTFLQFPNSDIPGIFDKPQFYQDYPEKFKDPKTPFSETRKVDIHGPDLAENGNAVVEIKAMDNKDRWFMLLDPENAKWKLLERQHDDAWVGGPGIEGWNMESGNKGWMPDYENYWFHSEESGYSHLYSVNAKTSKKTALSNGKFEIHDAWLSNNGTSFYVISNEKDPGERHLYKMDLDGKNKTQITSEVGNHEISMSPDEKWILSRFSYSNKPWELYLMKNESGAEMTKITESYTEEFKAYNWRDPELVYFKASDGENVRARIYKPTAESKNGAAVIFVHGAGYLQNAHKWWSSYYREYMFHNLLTDLGYTVLDIDYRASEGYGREWRTGIYRHMGGKDLSDQVDGAKYLVKELSIDPERIGMYGGSYGGFITLMALFNNSETFACGAAIRSVTDWAHYNHPYTSNILNTPVEDPNAFKKSSPIYFAEGLQDPLLMLHGMVDTNVQYQDIVRLSQKLIELGKTNWELASYPMEPHGFKRASSWADEYRRILELFEENLKD